MKGFKNGKKIFMRAAAACAAGMLMLSAAGQAGGGKGENSAFLTEGAEPGGVPAAVGVENAPALESASALEMAARQVQDPPAAPASVEEGEAEPMRSASAVKTVTVSRGGSTGAQARYTCLGTFRTTAYCSCDSCSEGWGNQTASGVPACEGRTVAVDPSVIRLGSRVLIDGREYVAEDTGGAIRGNRIDIYFENHAEAERFGVQEQQVYLRE